MEIPFSHKRDYCWSAPRPLPTCPVSWIGLLLFAASSGKIWPWPSVLPLALCVVFWPLAKLGLWPLADGCGVVMRSFQLQNFLTC